VPAGPEQYSLPIMDAPGSSCARRVVRDEQRGDRVVMARSIAVNTERPICVAPRDYECALPVALERWSPARPFGFVTFSSLVVRVRRSWSMMRDSTCHQSRAVTTTGGWSLHCRHGLTPLRAVQIHYCR
jgi:hypothetical protein